jgi:hypothetical protein
MLKHIIMKNTLKISLAIITIATIIQPACKKKDDADPQPITLDCTDITSDKILLDVVSTAGAVDYIVPCDISIEAALTISPGVVIQFAANTGFTIINLGSLSAVGTAGAPIVMKGITDVPGSWKGLRFVSNNVLNQLSFVTVTGGGSNSFDGLDIKSNIRVQQTAQLRITNSTIDKSLRDGIYTEGTSSNELNPLISFSANSFSSNTGYPLNISAPCAAVIDAATTFTANGNQKIYIRGGSILSDQTWQKTQVPFFISGSVSIAPYVTTGSLTISPGATIYFDAASTLGVGEYSSGFLKIVGTATQRITLSSETAIAGSWGGIGFQSTNVQNQISFTDISFGGCCAFSGNSSHKGNVVIGAYSAGAVTMSNTTINNSAACGINVSSTSSFTPSASVTFTANALGNVCN